MLRQRPLFASLFGTMGRITLCCVTASSLPIEQAQSKPAHPNPAAPVIYVSAQDGKPVRPDDDQSATQPDLVTVLIDNGKTLSPIAQVAAPTSMTGPPESVKISADGRWALITAAQRFEGGQMRPDGSLSLIDLGQPHHPVLAQIIQAGAGASGLALAGSMVAVSAVKSDSVHLFTLAHGRLTARSVLQLPLGSRPITARFLPRGKGLLVTAASGRIFHADVTADGLRLSGKVVDVGDGAGAMALSPDGGRLYVATHDKDAGYGVVIIDPVTLQRLHRCPLPSGVEGITLSPSGRLLEATLLNGSQLSKGAAGFSDHGVMVVLGVDGDRLRQIAQTNTGRICQGAAWNKDETRIHLQCALDRRIETYQLAPDGGLALTATLPTQGRPAAMASILSR